MTNTTHSNVDILIILAHPDDETFGHAGLMAWAQQEGLRVGLVCATRGESGEISDPSLGTPGMLGAVREGELRRAMAILGVDPVRLLSYRDSGMIGTPENDDSRSLVQAPREALLGDVVFQIRDLRPQAIITFGPDGVYGHPDHIRIGAAATEAVEVAAGPDLPFLGDPWITPHLYHVAVAREDLFAARQHGSGFFSRLSDEAVSKMGIPAAEITHVFDVSAFADRKLEAILCHATQLPFKPEPGSADDPATRPRLGKESLKRIPLPWNGPNDPADFLDALSAASALSSAATESTPAG